jgi:hypothetical protein
MDVVANAWAFCFVPATYTASQQVQTNYRGKRVSRPTKDLLAEGIQRKDLGSLKFQTTKRKEVFFSEISLESSTSREIRGKKSSSDLWSLFQAFRLSRFPAKFRSFGIQFIIINYSRPIRIHLQKRLQGN